MIFCQADNRFDSIVMYKHHFRVQSNNFPALRLTSVYHQLLRQALGEIVDRSDLKFVLASAVQTIEQTKSLSQLEILEEMRSCWVLQGVRSKIGKYRNYLHFLVSAVNQCQFVPRNALYRHPPGINAVIGNVRNNNSGCHRQFCIRIMFINSKKMMNDDKWSALCQRPEY